MRKNWSSAPPSSASTRFSSTETTLAAGSTCTNVILSMSSLLCAAIARNSCPSGSPGETAKLLAFEVLRRLDAGGCERHHRVAGRAQHRHHRLDLGALGGGRDHAGGIREAERIGAGRHHLHGVARAAAFVDGEVDAFLFVEALFLAVVERHVQPAEVPVEPQADGVLRERDVEDAASMASAASIDLEFHRPSPSRFSFYFHVIVTSAGCCETCHGIVMRSMISTT